jgi:hypothetical protein
MALLAALGNAANSQATLDVATAKREIDQAISANNAALRATKRRRHCDLERVHRTASREAAWLQRKPNFGVPRRKRRRLTSRAAEQPARNRTRAREKSRWSSN